MDAGTPIADSAGKNPAVPLIVPRWWHLASTIAGFLAGYGTIEVATGYRYVMLHWDWLALIAGLSAAGTINKATILAAVQAALPSGGR